MPTYGNWLLSDPRIAAVFNPNNEPLDANGAPVSPSQQQYLLYYGQAGVGGGAFSQWVANPNYNPNAAQSSPAPASPVYQFTFDTIGQTIPRTIGHGIMPLRVIWAAGVDRSGANVNSPTISFAGALSMPLDPDEEGSVVRILSGGSALFDSGSVIPPDGADDTTVALLNASLNNAVVYPGDEAQLPAPLIVADKGANVTNAFRGIRYIVFPEWPLAAGDPSSLSIQWQRTNALTHTYQNAAFEIETD